MSQQPARPYRILVTGSRDWTDEQLIRRALEAAWTEQDSDRLLVIVHGACPTGADAHASRFVADCHAYGHTTVTEEPHPADWKRNGRAAGPLRNAAMVTAGADLCLAFIRNRSRGATGCANTAERFGIPTRRWEET
ncbi:SLOG family protein [Streptomyces virginiae]|uniref:SLOG family protein n=1 Tax=Streptomyces virginiae TaxID=1961 RepID=UPI0036AF89EA